MLIEFSEEFTVIFNSLPNDFKILLVKYLNGEYDNFEHCFECEGHVFRLFDYNLVDLDIKNKIRDLIEYHNLKKKEIVNEFMKSVEKMKELFIEPPEEFNLTYHVNYCADRSGCGYLIVPYLNKFVADNTTSDYQETWSGKYGSDVCNYVEDCGGRIKLDCNSERPNKSFGLALQHKN